VLSFRLNGYLGLEACATVTNGVLNFEFCTRLFCVGKNVKGYFHCNTGLIPKEARIFINLLKRLSPSPKRNNSEAVMWCTERTCSSFEFTVLREMYGQRNSSGAYVHFNKHGFKTNLHKCNGLKYTIQFCCNCCCYKAFNEYLKVSFEKPAECMQVFMQSVCCCY